MTTPQPGPGGVGPALGPVDLSALPITRTVAVKAVTASQALMTGTGMLTAASAAETTGSARALAYLHDGTDTTGEIIGVLGLVSGGGAVLAVAGPGIAFRIGLYLEIVSGTVSAAVTWAPINYPLPG